MSGETSFLFWEDIYRLADKAKRRFGLPLCGVEPLMDKRARMYGDLTTTNYIRLRTYRLDRPRKPLAERTMLDTLAHELAHLRYPYHGRKHRAFKREIRLFWDNGR